ncbi:MAG: hypothetical protein ACO1SV_13960, partial [Fimbriimonas sp.]
RGRNPETPVAVVSKATHRDQRVATGTLRDIARRAKDLPAPAVIVVGEVVNVRAGLEPSWALPGASLGMPAPASSVP